MSEITVLSDDVRSLRNFYTFLQICGLHWEKTKPYRVYAVCVTVIILSAVLLMGYTVWLNLGDIDRLATVAHHYMLVIDLAVAVGLYSTRRKDYLKLLTDTKLSHDYKSKIMLDHSIKQQNDRIKKMGTIFRIIIISAMYMIMNIIINGFVEKHLGITKHMLLFPCWFPFDLDNIGLHLLAYIWEFIILLLLSFMAFGAISLIYLVYSHLKTEFKLLEIALNTTHERVNELIQSTTSNSDGSWIGTREAYIICITHCANHHVNMTKYFQNARSLLSYAYLTVFITGLVICVCAGFALVSDNTALKVKFIGISLLQFVVLFIMCWFGEAISEESDGLRLALYSVEWYTMPVECQRTLRIMMERSNRPLSLIAASGHKADLDTYMSLMKASYSYFNMMLAAQN